MYEHKVAERAMKKLAQRKAGVSIQDALTPKETDILIKRGHLFWWEYETAVNGKDRFLALTDAGSDCMTFVKSSLHWRRKWEIMKQTADKYYRWMDEAYGKLNDLMRQKQPPSGSLKMSIGSIEYEVEVTETNGQR